MELTVRAIEVGFGQTKYLSSVSSTSAGTVARCSSFPSLTYPPPGGCKTWPGTDRHMTAFDWVSKLLSEVGFLLEFCITMMPARCRELDVKGR